MSTVKKSAEKETDRNDYAWWNDEIKLAILERVFKTGAEDEEACGEAHISLNQLYYYQREVNTQFKAIKEVWKLTPVVIARASLTKGLSKNPDLALRYLERKKKDEFGLRTELTGKDGKDLIPSPIYGGKSTGE